MRLLQCGRVAALTLPVECRQRGAFVDAVLLHGRRGRLEELLRLGEQRRVLLGVLGRAGIAIDVALRLLHELGGARQLCERGHV